ncbi:F-box protein PP2-B3-like [Solanum dulcamara]|uniref:F-box protein PP2-B3-like n=1 Tax=Solanum dulcamara TaxID=45834 RepID=UPI0024859A84|nr:F-box protein PP2-B3-like [Solanum dulcamara]
MNSSNFIAPMNYFERLPEGCIFEIISKTTPADAVRSIILSKEFKFVKESDEIWGRFLPPDYQEIIDRSELPPVCNTKKEFFFNLCDSPILLDGGKQSFFLDKHSGNKCFMVAPTDLIISESDDEYSWQWNERPDSRFSTIADMDEEGLPFVRFLDNASREQYYNFR